MSNGEPNKPGEGTPAPEVDPKVDFIEVDGVKYKKDPDNPDQPLKDDKGNPVPFEPREGGEGGGIDYKADLEKERGERKAEREEAEKNRTRLGQAEFLIEKLKTKLKEEGIEIDEKEGLSESKVQEIILNITEKLKKDLEETFGKKTEELLRSLSPKPAGEGGGAGQKPPTGVKPPELPPEAKKVIARLVANGTIKWNEKIGKYVGKTGKIYDLEDLSDIASS